MFGTDLSGQVALVTGASRGIGAAIACRLARAGAKIGVNYNTGKSEAAQVVKSIGSWADVVVCDGFVGNILMKFTEGLGSALEEYLKQRLGPMLSQQGAGSVISELWTELNLPRKKGGPLFGINGTVVLGHGSSRADGVAGAIKNGVNCVNLDMVEGLRQELAEINPSGVLKVT